MSDLTDAEREALTCDCEETSRDADYCPLHADSPHLSPDLSAAYLLSTVERILTDRLAKQREQIAQAIQRAKPPHSTREYTDVDAAYDGAAYIARGES